jgi:hypothetical protein
MGDQWVPSALTGPSLGHLLVDLAAAAKAKAFFAHQLPAGGDPAYGQRRLEYVEPLSRAPRHTALENGLAPIRAGLILAGVFAIFRIAGAGIPSWTIAGIAAALLVLRPKLTPLILPAGGAIAFVVWHKMVPR